MHTEKNLSLTPDGVRGATGIANFNRPIARTHWREQKKTIWFLHHLIN